MTQHPSVSAVDVRRWAQVQKNSFATWSQLDYDWVTITAFNDPDEGGQDIPPIHQFSSCQEMAAEASARWQVAQIHSETEDHHCAVCMHLEDGLVFPERWPCATLQALARHRALLGWNESDWS